MEAIDIKGLSKVYKRKKGEGFKATSEDFWALKDLSLSIQQGDIVGVIGSNGAGKSTLLKILSRITAPTHGTVKLKGRVGSLLEVGTGFHHEMTGRENIYMNGNILGMSNAEIRRKLDEIVSFSGVGEFLDTPIKRYSTGMGMRLAFAVAAHLEPEILIIDEVLAVGDADFQKRCLKKMDTIGNNGRTILFVSHNMEAIRSLCNRCVWLDHGHIKIEDQDCDKVIQAYLSQSISHKSLSHSWSSKKNPPSKIKAPIDILEMYLTDQKGLMVSRPVMADETLKLHIRFRCKEFLKNMGLGYYLYTDQGQLLYLSISTDSNLSTGNHIYHKGEYEITSTVPKNLLRDGEYYLRLAMVTLGEAYHYEAKNSDINLLMVVNGNRDRSGLWKQGGHPTQPIEPVLEWSLMERKN